MQKKPIIGQTIITTIQRLGIHGEGIGHWNGFTLFIDGALPNEIVEAEITEVKKNYGRGKLISIQTRSPSRAKPPCPLFGKCGGCQLMHLNQQSQLDIKRQRVIDALERIGKFSSPSVEPCLPSPSTLAYRNKIQVPVRNDKNGIQLGFYARNSHHLITIDKCYIHCGLGEKVFHELKNLLKKSDLTAYDWNSQKGELRHIIIKTAVNTEQVLVTLVTNGACSERLLPFAKKLMACCPEVKGVIQNINQKPHNVVLGEKFRSLAGSDHIEEIILDLRFKVSPASFFQVNPAQAEQLYAQAIALAELAGNETVLDAYCGVGTLSLLIAKHAKQVIGVECLPQAIDDAKENARMNEIKNVSFFCDHTERWIRQSSGVDVIILNPPRKGCDPAVLDEIARLSPKRIIYISCDPATLARDLAILTDKDYQICTVQPVDMFPQTAHVETVARMDKV